MDLAGQIYVRSGVRSGKPCFVGTRIAVDDVLANYAGGIVVMKRGTATVTRAELLRAVMEG